MSLTWEIGGYNFHSDGTFEFGTGLALDDGKWVFHPPDQLELISLHSGRRIFRIERFAFRRLRLRGLNGKETIWVKDRKT